jgi:HK97 family phage major capsid protein
MTLTPERMVEISREVATKTARLGELVRKDEDGKLSRREAAELSTVRAELKSLGEQLPQTDPRALQPGARSSGDDVAGDTLTREQRVSDWLREHGDYRSSSGLGDGEQLSVGKMIRGAITGNWKNAEAEQRALSENVLANGGYALAPDLSARVIDRVRNNMAVMRLGATTVPMTTQQLYLARLAGGANVSWKSEGSAITESSPTFERLTLTTKTLPCLVRISAELFEDLSPEATDTIERELSLALSLELDRAALRGSGVLNERYIDSLEYGLLVFIRADIALAHPQAFKVVTGVRP